jgi:signal transduction histidine kinase
MSATKRWLRDLPLFAKVLLPFLAVVVSLGILGGSLIVRDLSSRAQARLEQELVDRSIEVRSVLRERELYLIESANFAANLVGMPEAIAERSRATVARLLQSVLALKRDLDLVLATDEDGRPFVEFSRSEPMKKPSLTAAPRSSALSRRVLRDERSGKAAGFIKVRGKPMLAIAAPICSSRPACPKAGTTVVAMNIDVVLGSVVTPDAGIALYAADSELLGSAGSFEPELELPVVSSGTPMRRTRLIGAEEVATLYSALSIQGRDAGTIALTIPTEPAFASVRGTGIRLAVVVVLAMAAVIAIGTALSRFILARVRLVLETNRALGRGELEARAPVLGSDELGELADGLNQMAEQLQASHATLELRVSERTDEVRRLLRERTEFFAGLSHEFRTPLAIILRHADLLLDDTFQKDPKKLSEMGLSIQGSAKAVLDLVNDIIELARAESGRIDVKPVRCQVSVLLREIRPTAEALASAGGLTAHVRVPRALPDVLADPTRVRAILINLIDNAVKYTPEGGTVTVGAQTRDSHVEFFVIDDGVGIPEDMLELVFEPFFTVRGSAPQRGQGSSGLGLALARRLVEAQGGTISVTSHAGEGSTLTFTLPLADEPEPARQGVTDDVKV